jgi:hypothetical protein
VVFLGYRLEHGLRKLYVAVLELVVVVSDATQKNLGSAVCLFLVWGRMDRGDEVISAFSRIGQPAHLGE